MHFEDIWNEAELVSSKLEGKSLEDVVKVLHSRVDNLISCANLPKDQALNVGEILFELATIVNVTERRNKTPVNIAAGLAAATSIRKEDLLDPEIADELKEESENPASDNVDTSSASQHSAS